MLPVSASISPNQPYDAVILGGGLAGLTLARQLHLEAPHIRVLVVEKRKHPVREAAFKVGESSVEIGAHYLQVVLKLEPHLRAGQLEKLGLRYFFPQGDNRDLARRVELGPPIFPPVPVVPARSRPAREPAARRAARSAASRCSTTAR